MTWRIWMGTAALLAGLSACGEDEPVCGNGNVEAGEACDDGNTLEGDECLSSCKVASCGDGVVQDGLEQCDDGNADDTDGCLSTCMVATCGDGSVQAGVETCDDGGANADDAACLSTCQVAACGDGFVHAGVEGCDDGNDDDSDACLSSCVSATCGDGVIQADVEQCDDGDANGDTGACTSQCIPARCGDGLVHEGVEVCDDGNTDDSDACPSTCMPAECGDGFVQEGAEQCDDGDANDDTLPDACRTDCSLAACGDGVIDEGEGCDDADLNGDTAACSATCQPNVCGDGLVHEGVEACDDGAANSDTGACLTSCEIAGCGDGFVHDGVEACDDGALNGDTAACLTTCESASCGDGLLHAGVEECDDGPANDNGAACLSDCSAAFCGDGFLQEGVEQCDLGLANADNGVCLSTCRTNLCGDGFVNVGVEGCDDGNAVDGDGCTASCEVEGDSCGAPTTIPSSSSTVVVAGDTGAFTSTLDLAFCSSGTASSADAVYAFTSPIAAQWEFILTPQAGFDAALGVLSFCAATPFPGDELGCADGPAAGGSEFVTVDLAPNQTVFLVVDGADTTSGPSEGVFSLLGIPEPFIAAGDPCTSLSLCAPGLICNQQTSVCSAPVCGDGAIGPGEECDDGNTVGGDGCTDTCAYETVPLVAGDQVAFQGSLETTDPTWQTPSSTCGNSSRSGNWYYDVYFVSNPGTLPLTVDYSMTDFGEYGYLHMFALPWDPTQPTTNCEEGSFAHAPSEANVVIPAGATRALIVSSGTAEMVGAYTLTVTAEPICGDGIWGDVEQCDDGNTNAGDGCSSTCTFEAGTTCTPTAGCFPNVCGDGIAGNGEGCDDGNAIDGDACSNTCLVNGATCASPMILTADAANTFNVQSDTTGVSADYGIGCGSSNHNSDLFYAFTAPVGGLWAFTVTGDSSFDTALAVTTVCGDNTTEVACIEEGGTGAPDRVSVELQQNETVFIVVDGYGNSTQNDGPFTLEGSVDPYRQVNETCDPTGASAPCGTNLVCDAGTSTCQPNLCGDGIRAGAELCDDGNTAPGDGCDATCAVELVDCSAPLAIATTGTTFSVTGNTEFNQSLVDLNGCLSTQHTATNSELVYAFTSPVAARWEFSLAPDSDFDAALGVLSTCSVAPLAADALGCADSPAEGGTEYVTVDLAANATVYLVVDGFDDSDGQPDDGAFTLSGTATPFRNIGDACDTAGVGDICPAGSYCAASTAVCTLPSCGNGSFEPGEGCDDGNTASGDGCSDTCQMEPVALQPGDQIAFQGRLETTDPTWQTPSSSCGNSTRSGNWYYDVYYVSNPGTLPLTVDYGMTDFGEYGYLHMFAMPWDPTQPTVGCEEGSFAHAPSETDAIIPAGETRALIVSSGTAEMVGAYTLTVTADAVCGDGLWGDIEQCEDGNTNAGDGCSSTCTFETGTTCTPAGGCFPNICGDGIAGNGEPCDDGNAIDGDACSNTCAVNGATCASAVVLTADAANTFTVQSDTTGASADYGIGCGSSNFNSDLFYEFTAPVAGVWTFSVTGDSSFDTALAVTTTCGDNTTEVACIEEGGKGAADRVEIELLQNETVFIVVDGYGNSTLNDGQFTLEGSAIPLRQLGETCDPNAIADRCASGLACDPTTLTCETRYGETCAAPVVLSATDATGFNVSGTTVDFGADYDADCTVSSNNPDVVHAFTAPVAGIWHFTVTGDSNFDTVLAVTSTCGDPNTEVACIDEGSSGAPDRLDVELQQNETVYIVVDGYGSSSVNFGTYTLDGWATTFSPVGGSCDPAGITTTCEFGSLCSSGVCVATVCGNGVIEPEGGEICDDGNQDDWDMCSNDCQIRGESCAAPHDLRLMDLNPSPGTVLVRGDLNGYANDHVPSCYGSHTQLGSAYRDVVFQISGNGVTDEHWTMTLGTDGTIERILQVSAACVTRNAAIACVPDADMDAPQTVSFFLGAHETLYVLVDSESTSTNGANYTLSASVVETVPAGGACDPTGVANRCERGAFCDAGNVCATSICGDTVVNGEEECDDGNLVDHDGCSADCYLEGDTCNAPYDLNVLNTSTTSGQWIHGGDVTGMTPDYAPLCALATSRPDVVYAFTAPSAGSYLFEETTGMNVVLYASGICPPTGDTADVACTDSPEDFTLALAANETVFVFVDPQSATASGPPTSPNYTLEVTLAP